MRNAGRLLAVLVVLLFTISAVPQEDVLVLVGRVTRIVDADTIDVQLDSGPIRVRFDSIDAPESRQPWGREATEALSRLLGGTGGQVELEVSEQDRYERLIAVVHFGGVNVNAWLVRDGHAWAYRAYLNDKSLPAVEVEARAARRGLWQASNPVPPWDWRRGSREPSDEFDDLDDFETPSQDATTATFVCGSKRYCGDMSSCDEAKFFFKQCGLSNLDGNDNDGIPCESLCR